MTKPTTINVYSSGREITDLRNSQGNRHDINRQMKNANLREYRYQYVTVKSHDTTREVPLHESLNQFIGPVFN